MTPREIEVHSRRATIAAVVSGSIQVVIAVVTGVGWIRVGEFGFLNLVDAALLYAFAWGFHRRSRTAGVLCLTYFLASKVLTWLEFGQIELVLALLFGYFYVQGTRAAFAAHKTRVESGAQPPAV